MFNYKIAARPDRRRKFEDELASTMDVALGILTACLNIQELKEQVRFLFIEFDSRLGFFSLYFLFCNYGYRAEVHAYRYVGDFKIHAFNSC